MQSPDRSHSAPATLWMGSCQTDSFVVLAGWRVHSAMRLQLMFNTAVICRDLENCLELRRALRQGIHNPVSLPSANQDPATNFDSGAL